MKHQHKYKYRNTQTNTHTAKWRDWSIFTNDETYCVLLIYPRLFWSQKVVENFWSQQARAATLMVLQSIEGLAPLSADPLMALQGHLGLLYMELWQHCSWSEAWDASFNLGRERSQHFHRQISVKERLNTKYRPPAGESDDRGKILPLQSQWSLEADFWARKWKDIEIGGFVGNGQGKSVPLLSSSHSEEGQRREDPTLVIGTQVV